MRFGVSTAAKILEKYLKLEAVCAFKTLATTSETTWRYITQNILAQSSVILTILEF
jgi:hypothetical protein